MPAELKPIAFTISEAAVITRLSERTLSRAISDGTLTVARVGGRRSVRILLNDLESWLADHREGRLADFDRRQKQAAGG
jgi:excisionase family DNA binding protein